MRPGSVTKVPAGKRPKVKKLNFIKPLLSNLKCRLRAAKLREPVYIAVTAIAVIMLLGVYDNMSDYVYVVRLNDREVGVVSDAKDVEKFVAHLTDRCGVLYGMDMEPGAKIDLVKEFRPDSKPSSEAVLDTIRQQMTFRTDAYMITVDGSPFVPVGSEEDLDTVIVSLKESYIQSGNGVKVLDAYVVEELSVEACSVEPDTIRTADEVVSLLVRDNSPPPQTAFLHDISGRGSLESRQAYSFERSIPFAYISSEIDIEDEKLIIDGTNVRVTTIEEATVTEAIPFEIEYVYDEELWVVQKEITTPGKDGSKEIVYHITRENGVELHRTKINETILEEPVTQIESQGTAKVPSVGSGLFIWPVEGGGEVTPGRGFSSWHTGIDIHGDTGTNILAADSGVVWFSGRGGSQGNYLILYHGSFWTLYLHNNENLVKEGDAVEQGDVIATLGSTGRSTGPHLHFEVRHDDGSGEWHAYYQHKPLDPLKFYKP